MNPTKNAQTALEDIAGIGQSILTLTAGRRDVPAIDALARQILSLSHDRLNQHGEIPF